MGLTIQERVKLSNGNIFDNIKPLELTSKLLRTAKLYKTTRKQLTKGIKFIPINNYFKYE